MQINVEGLGLERKRIMYISEKFDRLIDRISSARDQARDPEFKMMWDHKLRVLLKETLGSRE